MLSGFLSSGHLCLIHHLKIFDLNGLPSKRVSYIVEKMDFFLHSTKNDQYWLFLCQCWSDHQDQEVSGGNSTFEAVEACELAEATEVHEAGEVSKAWKITTEDFRDFQVLEFHNMRTNITFF